MALSNGVTLSSIEIIKTQEFVGWTKKLSKKEQRMIDSRLSNIQEFQHFGDCKNVGENLLELRWRNGRRVYFSRLSKTSILFLVGGLKNAQKKDIKKACLLYERYTNR